MWRVRVWAGAVLLWGCWLVVGWGWLGLFIVLPGEGLGVIRFTRSGFDVVRVGG